jgi:hypothetical protein
MRVFKTAPSRKVLNVPTAANFAI